jgi:hypothetical protein
MTTFEALDAMHAENIASLSFDSATLKVDCNPSHGLSLFYATANGQVVSQSQTRQIVVSLML